jgi:hypothetical protein
MLFICVIYFLTFDRVWSRFGTFLYSLLSLFSCNSYLVVLFTLSRIVVNSQSLLAFFLTSVTLVDVSSHMVTLFTFDFALSRIGTLSNHYNFSFNLVQCQVVFGCSFHVVTLSRVIMNSHSWPFFSRMSLLTFRHT